jgi:hypothetical protein
LKRSISDISSKPRRHDGDEDHELEKQFVSLAIVVSFVIEALLYAVWYVPVSLLELLLLLLLRCQRGRRDHAWGR